MYYCPGIRILSDDNNRRITPVKTVFIFRELWIPAGVYPRAGGGMGMTKDALIHSLTIIILRFHQRKSYFKGFFTIFRKG
jgi:hypothetical protein